MRVFPALLFNCFGIAEMFNLLSIDEGKSLGAELQVTSPS
jgi:hypothetical protein